jgi:aminomethyltransferase
MSLRTPFYDFHVSAGAKMVDYAGWEMPLLYRGIVQEHVHTREKVSLFDVSHMGRIRFSGSSAQAFLDKVATRNLDQQAPGISRYSLICNDRGGMLDDVIISRDERDWLMVCNAANRLKLLDHFRAVATAPGMDVKIDDQTEASAMLALQGPLALERLGNVLPIDIAAIKPHTFETAEMMFMRFQVFRGGYTGEDGVEIILSAKAGAMAMKMLGGKLTKPDATLQPAGLGARDTLRLEAALPLYGHELSEALDPLTAGLAWAVDLNKDFIGAAALRPIAQAGPSRKRAGLELEGRRIARQGAAVLHNGTPAGIVTSGTFGPTLQRSVALALLDTPLAVEETQVAVDVAGVAQPARVVKLPFYRRAKPAA